MFIPSISEREIEKFRRASSVLDPVCIGVHMDVLSIIEDAEERYEIHEEFDDWVAAVRDPASRATEGVRTIGSRKMKAEAQYEIAPLPDGRFAVIFNFAYHCGTCHGHGSTWTAYDTREQCVDAFLTAARFHFNLPSHGSHYQEEGDGLKSQREAQTKMQKLLEGDGLFGFMEPEPAKVESDPDEE